MSRNLQYWILMRFVRLSAEGYSRQEVVRMLQQNFATQPRHWSTTSTEACRSEESDHIPRRQTVDPNGQVQFFYLSSSSALGDYPLILEEGVSSEHWPHVNVCRVSCGGVSELFLYIKDNATPHTVRYMTAFLPQQDVDMMNWSALSPDMNPTKHV